MILSRTSQHAVKALLYLAARPEQRYILTKEIAAKLHLPEAYLGKILGLLSRTGWLDSCRGRSGGFHLKPTTLNVTLMEILQAVEGADSMQDCVLGHKLCSDDSACVMHCQWQPIKQEIRVRLENQKLKDLLISSRENARPGWLI